MLFIIQNSAAKINMTTIKDSLIFRITDASGPVQTVQLLHQPHSGPDARIVRELLMLDIQITGYVPHPVVFLQRQFPEDGIQPGKALVDLHGIKGGFSRKYAKSISKADNHRAKGICRRS